MHYCSKVKWGLHRLFPLNHHKSKLFLASIFIDRRATFKPRKTHKISSRYLLSTEMLIKSRKIFVDFFNMHHASAKIRVFWAPTVYCEICFFCISTWRSKSQWSKTEVNFWPRASPRGPTSYYVVGQTKWFFWLRTSWRSSWSGSKCDLVFFKSTI